MSDKRVSDMSDDEIRAMAGATGPVAGELARLREIEKAATPGPCNDTGRFITEARAAMHALLAAVEAALKGHEPANSVLGLLCEGCNEVPWPCKRYLVISAALLGKEATDG